MKLANTASASATSRAKIVAPSALRKSRPSAYSLRWVNAQDLLDAVQEAVNEFRGGTELTDDLTFVAIQFQPAAAAPKEPAVATA